MWFLHETHVLHGAREDEFEARMRDEWLPAVARLEGVRLLYYLKHAHGTGVSYNSITITALEDASAWERLAASVQRGPLQALSVALDDLRHDVTGKMFTPLPWSPLY